MTFAANRLQTRRIYLAYMAAVRLNSPIAHYKIPAADFVTKPPSGANMERGEGMEAGAGFPVHHGVGSLRCSALLTRLLGLPLGNGPLQRSDGNSRPDEHARCG